MPKSLSIIIVNLIIISGISGCISAYDKGMIIDSNANKFLVITVDVETGTLGRLADSDHVERLIYGKFGNQSAGITEMMDIADEVGVKISFFVDVFLIYKFPNQIIEVIQDIDSRGHDVQLHMHPSFNSTNWEVIENSSEWVESGAKREWKINCWTQETSDYWFNKSMEVFDQAEVKRPIAFRGGAYRYCDTAIRAMKEFNMTQSYNYNMFTENQNFSTTYLHNFYWENGVMEFPISYVKDSNGELRFSSRIDESTWSLPIDDTFERFYENEASTRVMTMILHSFSFLSSDENDKKYLEDYSKLESFRDFLNNLPPEYKIVSAVELQSYMDRGEVTSELELPLELVSNECN